MKKISYVGHLQRKIQCIVTIKKLPEDETICPEDDARRLSNLLQPIRYPAKDQYSLHRKIFVCIQDPLKCLSKRHNKHIQMHSQSSQDFLQNFLVFNILRAKSPFTNERASQYIDLSST